MWHTCALIVGIGVCSVFAPVSLHAAAKTKAGSGDSVEAPAPVRVMPVPVSTPAPAYPVNLQRAGVAGTVLVEFIVDVRGRVVDPKIVETPHPELGEAALDAVRRWRFRAGTVDGRPVNVRLRQTLTFGLRLPPADKRTP